MERQALQRAREAFLSGRTRPIEFRLQQLHALKKMITDRETEISAALKQDINRVSGHIDAERHSECCQIVVCGVPQGSYPGPPLFSKYCEKSQELNFRLVRCVWFLIESV